MEQRSERGSTEVEVVEGAVARAPGRGNASERIYRQAVGDVASGADLAVAGLGDGGAPLPASARVRFEQSLGADLGGVRVHTDGASAAAADALGARAFARGDDVHFGAGQYQPDDPYGMHLLAHEVAHTVQQGGPGQAAGAGEGAGVTQAKLAVSSPADAAEVEAERAADAMVTGAPFALHAAPAAIHRSTFSAATTDAVPKAATGAAPPAAVVDKTVDGTDFPSSIQWDKHAPESFNLHPDLPPALVAKKAAEPSRRFTFREIYDAYVDRELAVNLPDWTAPTAAAVRTVIGQGGPDAERLRKKLWQASQYAIIRTLNVEEAGVADENKAERYRPGNDTHCNVYAHDLVSALGGYVPRVWWKDPALTAAAVAKGEKVVPRYGEGVGPDMVVEMSANQLANWFVEWGAKFGWRREASPGKAQAAANDGEIVIAVAFNKTKREKPSKSGDLYNSGHISVVVAEQFIGDGDAGKRAVHGDNGQVTSPLQSQAGKKNIALGGIDGAWWDGAEMRKEVDGDGKDLGHFWICKPGAAKHAMGTPEELGARS